MGWLGRPTNGRPTAQQLNVLAEEATSSMVRLTMVHQGLVLRSALRLEICSWRRQQPVWGPTSCR